MIYIPHTIGSDFSITMLDWSGWRNSNSCLINVWGNTQNNRNWGITILPLRFWQHFDYYHGEMGANNKRFTLGIGLFSFFFDH